MSNTSDTYADHYAFLVTCLDGDERLLATRTTFPTRQAAEDYAKQIAPARKAEIVGCPFPVVPNLRPKPTAGELFRDRRRMSRSDRMVIRHAQAGNTSVRKPRD